MSCKAHKKYKNTVCKSNNVRRMLESLVAWNTIIIISRAKGGINESEPVSCTRLARKIRLSLHGCATTDGNQPMRTYVTMIRKSNNTSRVPAVRVHPYGRLDICNTMYSIESQDMEEAPFSFFFRYSKNKCLVNVDEIIGDTSHSSGRNSYRR